MSEPNGGTWWDKAAICLHRRRWKTSSRRVFCLDCGAMQYTKLMVKEAKQKGWGDLSGKFLTKLRGE